MNRDALGFEIVRPLKSHAELVMNWRNDPETLKASFHQDKKILETFWNEFCEEYFSLPELPPLFITCEGRRVGFLRFRNVPDYLSPSRKCCEVSINIAPDERRKGYGLLALQEVREIVKQRGFDDLYAEVKYSHTSSQSLFLKAGYREIESLNKEIADTGDVVSIRRYIDQLTPNDIPPRLYIIAEAGSNWRMGTPQRDRAMARALIDIAVEAGADAVKFQTFSPENVYVKNAGQSRYLAKAGIAEDIVAIYEDLALPHEILHELAEYCTKCGIDFMSTPFSKSDFDAVDPYVRRHKIASYEINHIHLIEMAAASGKPTFLSTGASVEEEITWAVNTYQQKGGKELTLLQCTAQYPADIDSMNLKVIPWLKNRYRVAVGLSDHSRDPLLAPIAATALGASVIEKHFTMSNHLPGPDHAFAVLPHELKKMVRAIRETERMLGTGVKNIQASEEELRRFAKRGIQALHTIMEGDPLVEGKNIAILRPGNQQPGIHPKFLSEMEGKRATRTIEPGAGILHGDWKQAAKQ